MADGTWGGRGRLPMDRPLRPLERARLGAEILLAYAVARRALRRAPIEVAVARMRDGADPVRDPTAAVAESRRLAAAVGRTLHLAPGDTRCLVRSLVMTRLLARRRVATTLVIGARTDPEFLAHAWVEQAGRPVLPPGDEGFRRLVEI